MYTIIISCVLFVLVATEKTYMDSLQPCNDGVFGVLSNFRFFRSKDGKLLYSCEVNVKHKVTLRNAKVSAVLKKCTSANLSSCTPFPAVTLPSPCSFRNVPQLPIKDMYDCIDPPIDCDFEQGTYKLTNCTLDLSTINMVSLGHSYWNAHITLYSRREKYLCLQATIHLA